MRDDDSLNFKQKEMQPSCEKKCYSPPQGELKQALEHEASTILKLLYMGGGNTKRQ